MELIAQGRVSVSSFLRLVPCLKLFLFRPTIVHKILALRPRKTSAGPGCRGHAMRFHSAMLPDSQECQPNDDRQKQLQILQLFNRMQSGISLRRSISFGRCECLALGTWLGRLNACTGVPKNPYSPCCSWASVVDFWLFAPCALDGQNHKTTLGPQQTFADGKTTCRTLLMLLTTERGSCCFINVGV